ncbi:MAG: hypothetical protein GQ527_03740 [Bacteroidales bacterium]|nr:hypothetical protein [Bacteroidales bacterium]
MKLSTPILSTAYFPPISWMALLYKNKAITIDLHESYSKQSYRNRCHIATANGLMALTVPVKKPFGNRSKTADITLDYSQNWQQLHWKSLKAAYQSSPYFLYYQDDIESIFKKQYASLKEMNEYIILEIASLLGFSTTINYSKEFLLPTGENQDFRFQIHPKKESIFSLQKYEQVFIEKHRFLADLSALDLLFNLGPEGIGYLDQLHIS